MVPLKIKDLNKKESKVFHPFGGRIGPATCDMDLWIATFAQLPTFSVQVFLLPGVKENGMEESGGIENLRRRSVGICRFLIG